MDFYTKGFFIHEFGDLKSANLIFHLPSPRARGNREILMISVITMDQTIRMDFYEEVLENFVKLFTMIHDAYQGLYYGSDGNPKYPEKASEVKNFLSK